MTAAQVVVVADDLTGANATAAGLAGSGLRAVSVIDGTDCAAITEFRNHSDAIVISLDCRHMPAEQTQTRVREALRAAGAVPVIGNRTDSTLRGNVSFTTVAALGQLREMTGERWVGLAIPAHPEAGRTTVDGQQLLHGQRLEDTELAHDARSPMSTSDVRTLLTAGTDLKAELIRPNPDVGSLTQQLSQLAAATDLVICDAETTQDIELLTKAASQCDVNWLNVDPGPGVTEMAKAKQVTGQQPVLSLLAVSGSATEITRGQLQKLVADEDVQAVRVDLRGEVDEASLVSRLVEAIDAKPKIVLLTSALEDADICPLTSVEADSVGPTLARIARRALEQRQVAGLYMTGGDVAAATLQELAASGLEVAGEVVGLAVYGALVGGPYSGMPIVTKGGLIGDPDCAKACLKVLEGIATTSSRSVRPVISRTPVGSSANTDSYR